MQTFLHTQKRYLYATLVLLLFGIMLAGCNLPMEATAEPPLLITPSNPSVEPTQPVEQPTVVVIEPTTVVEASTAIATEQPTAIPTRLPTMTPMPTPTELPLTELMPETFDALETWLMAARSSGMSATEAHRLLNEWGWLAPEARPSEFAFDFQAIDLSGDGRAEWLVVVKVKDSAEISTPRGAKYAGNLYVVADDAIVAYYENEVDITNGIAQRPQILTTNDLTGDGIADALVEGLGCGANTCYGNYQLLSYQLGYLDDLASTAMQGKQNPQPDARFNPATGEWRVELSVWNESGLGGVRETEIYAWNGSELAYVETLTVVPDDVASLRGWLFGQWQAGADFSAVQGHLREAGWLLDGENQAASADLDKNNLPDWAFVIADKTAEQGFYGYPVNIWVINPLDLFSIAPEFMQEGIWTVQAIPDVTGDGAQEFLAIDSSCGAHTCYESYYILSAHNNSVATIRPAHPSADVWLMSNSYSDWRVEEYGGSPVFMIHGGAIGSAGAGIVRTYTDLFLYSADDNQMHLAETILDPTSWRHHLLYEANDKTRSGHPPTVEAGIALYEQVIIDDTLDDFSDFSESGPGTARGDMNQYAAFRLIDTWLRPGDVTKANDWLTYLQTHYAETPITLAATALVETYGASASHDAACAAAQAVLATFDEPTGVVNDLGYGNPSLGAETLCP